MSHAASVDPLLLIAGLARVIVWATIAIVGYRQRRVLPLAFGGVASLTSVVFSLSNSHAHVPQLLVDLSTFVAFPIAVMILMSVLVSNPVLKAPRARRWHL